MIRSAKPTNVGTLFKNNINSLCKSTSSYLFYLNINIFDASINIVCNINPKDLAYIFPLQYNPKYVKHHYLIHDKDYYKKIISFYGTGWDHFIHVIKNHFTLNYFPLNNSKELPIINMFMKNVKIKN